MHRSDLVGRLAKYQMTIQAYEMKIEYRAGKHNTLCDFLSRYPVTSVNSIQINSLPTLQEIQRSQLQSQYKGLIQFLSGKIEDPPAKFSQQLDKYSIFNNTLYSNLHGSPKLLVPDQNLQTKIIAVFHDNPLIGSHLGIRKTYKSISSKYFWPKIYNDVAKFVKTCPVCQKVKTPSGNIIREELGSFPIPQRPFERIHTDIIGPLPQCIYGNKFISITVCAFSKFIICTPLLNQTTDMVIKALVNDVISKHGIPDEIVSDRGSNYTSDLFAQLNKTLGIPNNFTTSYNHKANEQVERLVKVITDSLTSYCSNANDLWSDFLQPVVFAYNCSINDTTGYSPFYVVFGRHPITWCDIIHQLPSHLSFATDSFSDQFEMALKTTIIDVGEQIAEKTVNYKSGYDFQHKVHSEDISNGDLVLLRDDAVRTKFTNQWKGPFEVTQITRPNITIVSVTSSSRPQTVHIDRPKLYCARPPSVSISTQNRPNHNIQPTEMPKDVGQPTRRSQRLLNKQNSSSFPTEQPAEKDQ
ncbi:integrase core domain protein [Ancylostoma duodenale]|uniref:RNA-directed DNA polymerase n=1 Tax=Ancylostoma duodenale TaxID=51022 RepID=A0A0C2FEV7_9BILA|nr:integrase core domain protein [Ancylostoma duodenale]